MPRRGEIYFVDFSPSRGSEQAGVRPGLIIQNNAGNLNSPTTIVAAISTQRRRMYPFHVPVTPAGSGLPQDSVVKCEQIKTVDQNRLMRLAGSLNPAKMREIDEALHLSLGPGH
jgi:mRNA interferase MazF